MKIKQYSEKCIRFDYIKEEPTDDFWLKNKGDEPSEKIKQAIEFNNKDIKLDLENKNLKKISYEIYPKEIRGSEKTAGKINFEVTKGAAYYGLGQQQKNDLDYAGKRIEVYHNYKGEGGEITGVPILISSSKYAIIINTAAQVVCDLRTDGVISFEIDYCKDLSFIVLWADTMLGLYAEIKNVIGAVPMPLKSSLGYIQCKQRYDSQEELLNVARKYREKKYPIDMMVVDWFYWQHLGDMDLWTKDWPDAKNMNEELKSMDFDTMISVWPRFMKESRNYHYLEKEKYLVVDDDGEVVYGTEDDRRGALIDSTNDKASKWFWDTMHQNLGEKGFDAWWTDENEPDLWPYDYTFAKGKGYEIFNIYPYSHSKAIYDGHRKDCGNRCCILSRSAFLGVQQFGTQFWSSDIYPTWEVLKKQIPTAINFCASSMGYWSSDIGGWQPLPDYQGRFGFDDHELVLETTDENSELVLSREYPELYVRWFQFGAFSPICRAHGTRDENEVWSFGEAAEEIIVKYLKLRYKLMPYIYSMAYKLMNENIPLLQGMFLIFDDEELKNCKDQYMFGDSLLVAPVVERGAKNRKVYLPAGMRWYDFWTNECFEGGQMMTVETPLELMPIFVKENTILPMQDVKNSTKDKVDKIILKLYGVNTAEFVLYEDDGCTYNYENGEFEITNIIVDQDGIKVKGARTEGDFIISRIE